MRLYDKGSPVDNLITKLMTKKPEKERVTFANVTTPDRLIVAHVLELLVKDHEKWEYSGNAHTYNLKPVGNGSSWIDEGEISHHYSLTHPDIEIEAIYGVHRKRKCGNYTPIPYKYEPSSLTINDVEIDPQYVIPIIEMRIKSKKAADKVKAVADKALADMKLNEDRWNLVESLLGLKRNAVGALVPVNQASKEVTSIKAPAKRHKSAKTNPKIATRIVGMETSSLLEPL